MRMARGRFRLLAAALLFLVRGADAASWYVATNGNDAAAGTNWASAKQTIQAAVDAAASGDTVLVGGGSYASGGRVVFGSMTNRVAITKAIAVQGVEGPAATFLIGAQHPGTTCGDAAVRCAYVTNGALLAGFTLTNGATRGAGDRDRERCGGGAWCEPQGVVSNCVLAGNTASHGGGGACFGTLTRCVLIGNAATNGGGSYHASLLRCSLSGNRADYGAGAYYGALANCAVWDNEAFVGGGAYEGSLSNCTVAGNTARSAGGGCAFGRLKNCIVFDNAARGSPNWHAASLTNCCTSPLPAGEGNITNEPLIASVAQAHLLAGSPCIDAGNNAFAAGEDLDGEPRIANGTVDIGCDEFTAPCTGALAVAVRPAWTAFATGYAVAFEALVVGAPHTIVWEWGDGTATTNRYRASHIFPDAGDYDVVLTAANASGASIHTLRVSVAAAETRYVRTDGGHVPPFTTWAHAATTIQAAVDASLRPGDQVLVSNGVYATGGRAVHGLLTNRVAIALPILVRSVNGPAVTAIRGARQPGATNGDSAARCAYLTNGARLVGFTLTGGATRVTGDIDRECNGGGVWCEPGALLSNCTIAGNAAAYFGGGACYGALDTCALAGNAADFFGGGVYIGDLTRCILSGNVARMWGGGAYEGTLDACSLLGNSARSGGGGCYGGTLNNCALAGNVSSNLGGGAFGSALNNCTLAGNAARTAGGGSAGGLLKNCIVYFNTAPAGTNWFDGTLQYCCTTPLPAGSGHLTNQPRFVASNDLRLAAASPCIDAGDAAFLSGAVDLDAHPRLSGAGLDLGAYEFQGYWGWAGAITNGLTNPSQSATGDGYPNLLKYATGSSPTTPDSLARLEHADAPFAARFNRNTNATDIVFIVEAAAELADGAPWIGIATNARGSWGSATNVTEGPPANPVSVTVGGDAAGGDGGFLRLRIIRP